LCSKIHYVVNPNDAYPKNFSGHLRAALKNGADREFRQPHMRGGAQEPLATAELEAKFIDNAVYGGWSPTRAERLVRWSHGFFDEPTVGSLEEVRS
jgi:hypothetical protein